MSETDKAKGHTASRTTSSKTLKTGKTGKTTEKSRSAVTGRYGTSGTKKPRSNAGTTTRTGAQGAEGVPASGKTGRGYETGARADGSIIEVIGGEGKSEVISLTAELREYREALIAQIDNMVVPGVIARLAKGAASLAPVDLARRMLSVAPAPAPTNKMAEQLGPEFYDTNGVSVMLAEPGAEPVSKQAVEQRRKRRTLLALQTSDGRWIYPTWQFRDHDVMPGLSEVLAAFERADRETEPFSTWSIGTWLTTPLDDLDGATAVQWLDTDADRDHLLTLARDTASRWAA